MNNVRADVLNQGSARFEYCGDLPGVPGGDVEIYGDYCGACFLVFGGEAGGSGGQSDNYFKAQGAQDSDLVVDPGCSSDGFDDMQDLHDKRAVMARSLMNALKTIPQKHVSRRVQRCRRAALKVTNAGYKSDAGQ
jgi:hypothetical protein